MAQKNFVCLFILVLSFSYTLTTHTPSSLVCNDDCSASPNTECRLATSCKTCTKHSGLRCFREEIVEKIYDNGFNDEFCGPQGVVIKETANNGFELDPFQCVDGECPPDSICVRRAADNLQYCCAEVPEERRCKVLELISQQGRVEKRVVEGNDVTVVSVKQIEKYEDSGRCVLGKTFGYTDQNAYADEGCKGQFLVCYDVEDDLPITTVVPPEPGQICQRVNLFSRINRPAVKSITDKDGNEVPITSMDLVVQEPDSVIDCTRGKSFSFDGPVATSTGGCRGRFRICYEDTSAITTVVPDPGQICKRVNLFSRINRPAVKSITDNDGNEVPISSMTLVVQEPDSVIDCTEGESFSFDGPVATSTGGCRGRFRICYEDTSAITTVAPDGQICKRVNLFSRINRPAVKSITDNDGNEVPISSMTLVVQEPDSVIDCTEGESFSFDGPVATSTAGCRGRFRVCYEDTSAITTAAPDGQICKRVNLFSRINRPAVKSITDDNGNEVPISSMTLVVQEPDSVIDCTEGESFSFDGPVATSTGGCRGRFRICYDDLGAVTTAAPKEPVCETIVLGSKYGQPPTVANIVDSNNNPVSVVSLKLKKYLSYIQCVEWYNFYFVADKVVVAGGCKGEFEVCYLGPVVATQAPLTQSTEPEPDQTCVKVKLFSSVDRPVEESITDEKGNYVTITSMEVAYEYSKLKCEAEVSFSYTGTFVRASKGCRATFRICYYEGSLFTEPPGQNCSAVNLLSRIERPDEVTITDVNGKPVAITSMSLIEQKSDIKCEEGTTYSYSGSVARSSKGCRGSFYICYNDELPLSTTAPGPEPLCRKYEMRSTIYHPHVEVVLDDNGNPAEVTKVILLWQLSYFHCIEWYNYYFDGYKVIVQHGCEGIFKVCFESLPTTAAEAALTVQTTAAPGQICIIVNLFSRIARPAVQNITDATGNEVTIRSMELAVQEPDSRIDCTEGESFSFSGSQAKSTSGCRGRFRICYDDLGALTTTASPEESCRKVNLFSRIARPQEKTIEDDSGNPLTITSMEVFELHSKTECIEGETFSFSGSVARSNGGCRAVFQICYEDAKPLTTPNPLEPVCKTLVLESTKENPATKDIVDSNDKPARIVSLTLKKQLSHYNCLEWYNFYFVLNHVVVKGGCGGAFIVCYQGQPSTTEAPLVTQEAEPGQICVRVNLFSRIKRPAVKTVTDAFGNEVTIRSMELAVQEPDSRIDCTEGESFSFSGSQATSTGGCRGRFRVCYDDAGMLTTTLPGEECVKVNLFSRLKRPEKKTITDGNGNPVSITSMNLVEQHSEIKCTEGDTYSFLGSMAQSVRGCRGTFRICYKDELPVTTTSPDEPVCERITLDSTFTKPATKRIFDANGNPAQITSMQLKRSRSDVKCVEWYNYFFRGNKAVANGGCKGVFDVCYDRPKPTTTAPLTTVPASEEKCVKVSLYSYYNKPDTQKVTDDRGNPVAITSVELIKQKYGADCKEGVTYKFVGSVVKAFGGCRGRFKVCYNVESAITTASPSDGRQCVRVTLKSSPNQPQSAEITSKKGTQIYIVSARVVEQLSNVPCEESNSFRFNKDKLQATKGCAAVFKVCYEER